MGLGALDGRDVWNDAEVEGKQRISHRGMAVDDDFAPAPVDCRGGAADESRTGSSRQALKVDLAGIDGVLPGHPARQHAGIGCGDFLCDQRQSHIVERLSRKGFEDEEMGVAAARSWSPP